MILTAWHNLNKVILLAVVVVKWSAYVPYIPTIRVRIPLDLCKISVEKNENKIQTEAGLIHFLKNNRFLSIRYRHWINILVDRSLQWILDACTKPTTTSTWIINVSLAAETSFFNLESNSNGDSLACNEFTKTLTSVLNVTNLILN